MRLLRTCLLLVLSAFLEVIAQPTQPAELLPRETGTGVLFQCRAPGAQRVFLAGDFNGFARNRDGRVDDPLFALTGPDSNGVFHTTVALTPGLYRYQFVIDGTTWLVPAHARPRDEDGNAYLVVDGTPDPAPQARDPRPPRVQDGLVHFELFAPEAHVVFLAGTFNRWADNREGRVTDLRFAMRGPDADGLWRAALPLGRGRHAYQFVLNGNTWIPDPLAAEITADRHAIVEVR